MMDDWLARVLEMLDDARLLDDTLVIVTSDHGENLGESNLVGHAFSLDERLIKIPLIAAGPGAFSIDSPMSLVHLPKLIADGLGLKDHPWEANPAPDGIVVSEYDSMGTRDDPRVVRVTGEWSLDDDGIARLTTNGTAATDGRMKLVREHGKELLYDLVGDPKETRPVDARQRTDTLVEQLRSAIENAEAERALVKPLAVSTSEGEREDLEERLKLLGYL
jgi:arylsulfatase A-like enzyme